MILLTRLNGSQFYLNVTHIETVEATPDTVITLSNGKKYLVQEPADQLAEQIRLYYKEISMSAVVPLTTTDPIE